MKKAAFYVALLAAVQLVAPGAVVAETAEQLEQRLKLLEDAVKQQQRIILEQQRMLDEQQQKLSAIDARQLELTRGAGVRQAQPTPTQPGAPAPAPQGTTAQPAASPPDRPVGEAPEEERPEIAVISDYGGVLTPTGTLVVEPTLDYSHSNVNRLTFRGIELQDTVLIGVIEASDADRDLFSPSLTLRYGLFDRFELEAKVPYVMRDDRVSFLIPQAMAPDIERTDTLDGDDLGDIEVAAHYQITQTSPFLVGNLRFKTRTGEGPFDIERDDFGIEEELPTGSGFYAVEPSLTVLFPTDPVVLFASLSYQVNFADDVNEEIGDVTVRDVDPGDAIGVAFGMGFSVNDQFSFNLGYKHHYIFETETEIIAPAPSGRRTEESNSLHVGSALFGMGYRVSEDVGVNLDLELGATDDAPDMRVLLRVPVAVSLF
jgi:hypothetical protein